MGENENTPGSDEEVITLRPVKYSMDIEMILDLHGDSASTSDNEEKNLDERIFFRKKFISAPKEIK